MANYNQKYDDRRGNRRGNGKQHRNGNRRPPLDWVEAKTIDVESVRISISEAEGSEGQRIQSFSIGRIGRDGRTSKFLQPRDKEALAEALDEAFSFMGV